MRYRPASTGGMLEVLNAAHRFELRKVFVRFRVPVARRVGWGAVIWSPIHRTSCDFLRLGGETPWLRFVDRSKFLMAARISLDHGALPDACCLYHHPEVR